MEPLKRISEIDEAEFKVMVTKLFRNEGVYGVLACIHTMREVEIIMLRKLNELLEEERYNP